ncbi:hypothetical protein CQW23_33074 [Capsicum baccatum]|uniref:Ubiquitin-like protease family profile domain-containing protein n=1 Tax=Capsicum baccatum TaxID=33114 RepID=A0A2G2V2Y3_CAPBA|nr:hypothetical protein CQW23_33074 [Capsicum baccatum]
MDYAGAKTSPQHFSPNIDQILDKNQDGTKGCTDLHPEKINVEIDSQHLIPDELLRSINLDYIHSEKIVHHDGQSKSIIVHSSANRELQTPIQKISIRRPSKFKESPYTMKFGSAAGRSTGNIHKFPQKHPFVYHPIDGIVDTKIVKKFMVIIRFVLAEIEKLAEIISLCLQACDFYDKKEIDLQNHPRYKDKDSSDMFDFLFEENLPQQLSESLDCGVYMVAYAECLS